MLLLGSGSDKMENEHIYFSYKGPESFHFEIVVASLCAVCILGILFLIIEGLYNGNLIPFISAAIFVSTIILLILVVLHWLEEADLQSKYGEVEPLNDRIQIYVYSDKIVYIKRLIGTKEKRKVILAENTRDIRVRPTLMIYRPKDYRKIAKEFEICTEVENYERMNYWITLPLPKIDRKHKKELKKAVEEFKKRNKIGKYAKGRRKP